ncbi:thioredoxin family protein [Pedobacter sp. MW01-1-1]|uniref:thioredoxin family protein n=1 Tax=Pedobacter sp. MW01-1-1 TaxID=3383027 RepID=UPI003FED4664
MKKSLNKKITFLLIIVCMLITANTYAQGIKFLQGGYAEAIEKAKERKLPIFIDWYADWCVPCKMMDKEVFVDKKLGDYFNQHFVSVKLNTEQKENLELVKKYQISAMPTLMFIDADGEVLFRVSSSMPAEDLMKHGKTVVGDLKSFEALYDEYQKDKSNFKVTQELLTAAPGFVTIQTGMEKKKWIVRVEKIFNDYAAEKMAKGDEFINANDYRIAKTFHRPEKENDVFIEFMVKNMDKYIKNVGKGAAFYVVKYNTELAEEYAKNGDKKYLAKLDRIKGDMRSAYALVERHKLPMYDVEKYNCDALYALNKEKDVNKFIQLKNELFTAEGDSISPVSKAMAVQTMYTAPGVTITKENHLAAKEWIISSLSGASMPLMQRINITTLLGDVNKKLGNIDEAKKAYNQAYAETLQIEQERNRKYFQAALTKKIELLKLE